MYTNSHVHSPYSFSAFSSIKQMVEMARGDDIKVLGINDFYSANGFKEFGIECKNNNIYPMFNIEFITLDSTAQASKIRFNDPNNYGRMYFIGKGIKSDFTPTSKYQAVVKSQTEHIKKIIDKVNSVFGPYVEFSFDEIKKLHGKDFIGERHVAREIKRKLIPDMSESKIRSIYLKSGGSLYVKESEENFMTVHDCIDEIKSAGGLPCYPVLFDHNNNQYTEFESDLNKMYDYLCNLGVYHLDIIPDRNGKDQLIRLVEFFDKKGFYIMFGTEHNTEEMKRLRPLHLFGSELSQYLKDIAFKGCCSVAAHQEGHSYHSIELGESIIKSYI